MSIKDSAKRTLLRAKAHSISKQLDANCFFYASDLCNKLFYFLYLSRAYRLIKDCKKLIDEETENNDHALDTNIMKMKGINANLQRIHDLIEKKDQFVNGESLKKLKEIVTSLCSNNTVSSGKAALRKFYEEGSKNLKDTAKELKSYKEYLIKILEEEFKKITTALKNYKKKPTNGDKGAMYLHEIYEETNNIIHNIPNSLLNKNMDGMSIKNLQKNLDKLTKNIRAKLAEAGALSNKLAQEETISILNCESSGHNERLPRSIMDVGIGIGLITDLK